jgi:amidohydrolase
MSSIVPDLATIKTLAEKYFDRVVQLRRDIHAHPELAYEEEVTSGLVRTELENIGWKVLAPIAKTGVVALLECKQPESRCIGLRADMDALPIQEQNNCSYTSVYAGKMHACGHDAHTANLLGVAMILSELRNELTGTYKLVFQPSEEKMPSGAAAMISEGVLLNPKVEKMLGWHVHPELQAGEVGFKPGKFMASADEIYLTVIGKGGHAAQPHQFISPLIVSAEILLALQQYTDVAKPVVLTFGKITADGATNVVPEKAYLAGTLRCFDEQQRKAMHEVIQQTCTSIAQKHNASCEVNIVVGYPVLVNNEALTQHCVALAGEYLGTANVVDLPQRMGAEDFAFYSHHVPVCFYRVGVGNTARNIQSPIHSATFDIDEDALKVNIGLMSWLAVNA